MISGLCLKYCLWCAHCCAACGNGVCERGEECRSPNCSTGCASDCPVFVSACPFGLNRYGTASSCSSNGACQQGTGRCSCYAGYTGDVCSVCTSGYLQLTRGGACIYLPGALSSCEDGVSNGNEEGVDCGGPNCIKCAARLAKVSFIVASVAGLAAAFVVAVVGLYIRRWYRLRQTAVVPVQSTDGPRRVSLMNSRRVVLGKQHSRRASSTVTPIINIEWSQQGSGPPSHSGHVKSGVL
jgi:hypothetical protein